MKPLPFHNSPVLKNQYQIGRGRVVLMLLGGAFLALALRALYLQGITTEFLVSQGASRYERTLVLHASRGKILDRNGVVLAASIPARSIWADPDDASRATPAQLKELAQQHRLCLSILGLEKTSKRGCFGLQIKTCLGACIGQEERARHDNRFLSALTDSQVEVWPFAGPIDVIETSGAWVQKHRINNWCYLGTQCSKAGNASPMSEFKPNDFDLDSYKILVKPVLLKTVQFEIVVP